jgi:hypothetical protein
MDATIQAPRVVEMAASASSSLVYIARTDVERWMSGARSALPSSTVMAVELHAGLIEEEMINCDGKSRNTHGCKRRRQDAAVRR